MVDLSSVTETGKAWFVDLTVNSELVNFKVDTGAAVTALPAEMANIFSDVKPSQKTLRGAGNHKLKIAGRAKAKLCRNDTQIDETVYLVEGLVTPLLGKPAISKLGLIQFIHEVEGSCPWFSDFPEVFKCLGNMKNEVNITLKEEHTPFVQSVPRRIAAARKKHLKLELERMERLGVIKKIEKPTEWCSPCIVVPKKNGKIRVCIDFTKLNKAVMREYHPLPTTEETLSELGSAVKFSKLDANCGYWQMRLSEQCQELTTFITPFGRYFCKRLPFGISSAPEIFQREMQKALVDCQGDVCQMDDILVYGKNQQEHDVRLKEVIKKLKDAGITLNREKCEFNMTEIVFLGHIISSSSIKADPKKTEAIVKFANPTNKKELRRFFGVVNYLGKLCPKLAEDTHELRKLLHKDNTWVWGPEHSKEFEKLKQYMANPPTLTPYRLEAPTMLSTDASAYGLGAAVLQKVNDTWQPVAYASRTLSSAEKKYAQIEKEALAICWGCSKFHYYLAGREFSVETDHKPLIAILGEKELAKLPLRVQRFRLKMMSYNYSISFTPGKKMILADALSRSPLKASEKETELVDSKIVSELVDSLAISHSRMERLKASLLEDQVGVMLLQYIENGWPHYSKLNTVMKGLHTFKELLTCVQGVVYYMNRAYIPKLERNSVLAEIHKGHQGENKCIRKACEVVWWPGMTKEIRELVKSCPECLEYRRYPREPLISTALPERPWWRLAIDLFEKEGQKYLVVVDYFSRFITAHRMQETNSEAIVRELHSLFCMLGIPNSIVSDNGPQFVSDTFREFTSRFDIQHVTSSPRYAQSNGEAERAVQTVKNLMKKNLGLPAALCAYRDTPLANGYSPAQLLFGRGMNSMGFINDKRIDLKRLNTFEGEYRKKQEGYFNKRYGTRVRQPLTVGQSVVVSDPGKLPVKAKVVATKGREVVAVGESDRLLRRNRQMVRPSGEFQEEPVVVAQTPNTGSHIKTRPIEIQPDSQKDLESGTPIDPHDVVASDSNGVVAPCVEQDTGVVASEPQESVRERRNSNIALNKQTSNKQSLTGSKQTAHKQSPAVTRAVKTRSGREVKKPKRLNL